MLSKSIHHIPINKNLSPSIPTQPVPKLQTDLRPLRPHDIPPFARIIRHLRLVIIKFIVLRRQRIFQRRDPSLWVEHIPRFDARGALAGFEDQEERVEPVEDFS